MRQSASSLLPECDIDSDAIAGMFVAVFERELSDAGFVEVAEAFGDHPVVLFLCGLREWQVEAEISGELQRDAAILSCVRSGEKAAVPSATSASASADLNRIPHGIVLCVARPVWFEENRRILPS